MITNLLLEWWIISYYINSENNICFRHGVNSDLTAAINEEVQEGEVDLLFN